MNKPFISIIIPIYNCSQYILRLLNSILEQDFDNYEIIVVDDGSTDNLNTVLSTISDPKIKFFHKKNGGVSDARNFGISKSDGKYILFADADDYYENNLFQEIIPLLEKDDYDIICFNFYNTINDNDKIEEFKNTDCYSKKLFYEEGIDKYLNGKFSISLKRFPCNKIYKRQLIIDNNMSFPIKQRLAEDMIFNMEYTNKCRNLYYINKPLYNYCYQPNSITRKYFNNLNCEILLQIDNIRKLLEKYNILGKEHYIGIFYISNMTLLFSNERIDSNYLERKNKIYDYFNSKEAKSIISKIKIGRLNYKQLFAYIIVKLRLYYVISKIF